MRQAVLFYSFIAIFIVTAIVTLLGVVGAVNIPATQLNMLLAAFLIELAGAVVALYKRTDFFAHSSDNLANSLGSAIEAFDQVSDKIEATLKKNHWLPIRCIDFLFKEREIVWLHTRECTC